jgi:hypothetical protein
MVPRSSSDGFYRFGKPTIVPDAYPDSILTRVRWLPIMLLIGTNESRHQFTGNPVRK